MSDGSSPVTLALECIESGDLASAQRCLEWERDAEKVSGDYGELTKILYTRHKDIRSMLVLGRAGIDYQLREAERVAADDAARSVRLRTAAKTLAFNIAANCWPGWGDDGVAIEAAQIEEGLRLANLSFGLVQELALGPQQLGTAYWLVGALDLAAGRTEAALTSFDSARACFSSGGDRPEVLLVDGYRAIALSATADLDQVIGQLEQNGSEKPKFFIGQLRTAARILRQRPHHQVARNPA